MYDHFIPLLFHSLFAGLYAGMIAKPLRSNEGFASWHDRTLEMLSIVIRIKMLLLRETNTFTVFFHTELNWLH